MDTTETKTEVREERATECLNGHVLEYDGVYCLAPDCPYNVEGGQATPRERKRMAYEDSQEFLDWLVAHAGAVKLKSFEYGDHGYARWEIRLTPEKVFDYGDIISTCLTRLRTDGLRYESPCDITVMLFPGVSGLYFFLGSGEFIARVLFPPSPRE